MQENNELRASLWDAANTLRGSAVDRTDWKGRAQNFLDHDHSDEIVSWYRAFEDIEDRAKVATIDEIKKEGWTLNISRYVLPPIGEDIPPLPEAVDAFKTALADARAAEDHLRKVLTEGGWLQ